MIFHTYADPSHAWCKVPLKKLKELKIQDKISSFSYMKGDYVYLEEDKDLLTFYTAMTKAGHTVTFRESHTDKLSKIRNYQRYKNE